MVKNAAVLKQNSWRETKVPLHETSYDSRMAAKYTNKSRGIPYKIPFLH